MLPKKFRLKTVDFYRNPQKPVKLAFIFFLIMLKRNQFQNPRFCINVPKALDKRSVYRHRTRRIATEAIRKYLDGLDINVDVFIKMKKIINQDNKDLFYREFERVFQREKLYSVFDRFL